MGMLGLWFFIPTGSLLRAGAGRESSALLLLAQQVYAGTAHAVFDATTSSEKVW